MDKVFELLREYHDLLSTNFIDLNGIIGDLRMMKFTLKPDMNLVKKRRYCLNLKYKEKVRLELDKMLTTDIIEPVKESY